MKVNDFSDTVRNSADMNVQLCCGHLYGKVWLCKLSWVIHYGNYCVLLENLVAGQVVRSFAVVFWTKTHYRLHKSLPLDPILSHMNPVHTLTPYISIL
jgi:hypothetical protein